MRYLPILLSLGAGTVTAQSMTKCIADNCLRAIRASAFPDRSGYADCVSFFQGGVVGGGTVTATEITTISDTISITTTITTPVQAPPPDCKCRRQAPAPIPIIPAYASKCSGILRYSSACACIGITETAAPTTTTVTETSTIMVSASSTATVVSFLMQLEDGYPGFYVARRQDGIAFASSNIAQAVQFYLQPDGRLEISGGVPVTGVDFGIGVASLAFDGIDVTYLLTCQIDSHQYVTCKAGPAPQLNTLGTVIVPDGNYFVIGFGAGAIKAFEGQAVAVKAVPAP